MGSGLNKPQGLLPVLQVWDNRVEDWLKRAPLSYSLRREAERVVVTAESGGLGPNQLGYSQRPGNPDTREDTVESPAAIWVSPRPRENSVKG